MVTALLTSMRTMLRDTAQSSKEFKSEAIKNNKNVSSVLKDVAKMFQSSKSIDAKQNTSLDSIESHTLSTSSKVDRTNSLLQESISLQSQMLSELRNVSKSLSNLAGGGTFGSFGSSSLSSTAATALGIGAGAGAGALASNFFGMDSSGGSSGGGSGAGGSGGGGGGTYTPGKPGESTLASQNLDAAEKAILETIAKGESSGKYNIINYVAGGGKPAYFNDYSQHPFKGKKGYTAAGRYQFLWTTWADEVKSLGEDPDKFAFTPENQDRVAVSHAKKIYERKTGRNLLEDIRSEDPRILQGISRTLRPTWHGIKGGEYLGSAYKNFKDSEGSNPEGDETGVSPGKASPQSNAMGGGGGNVFERQKKLAGIRKGDLSDKLRGVLRQAAAAAGVDVVVYSGGQPAKGKGGPRTGSTRHDLGNAADLYLMKNGKKLSDTNKEDREIMAKFVSAAVAAGATGVGAGHGYMGPSNIHVGFGKSATWGGAPWIKAAASGVYSNKDLQAQSGGGGGYSSSGGGGGMGGGMQAAAMGGSGGGMGGGLLSSLGALGFGASGALALISGFFGIPMSFLSGAGSSGFSGAQASGGGYSSAPGSGATSGSSGIDSDASKEPEDSIGSKTNLLNPYGTAGGEREIAAFEGNLAQRLKPGNNRIEGLNNVRASVQKQNIINRSTGNKTAPLIEAGFTNYENNIDNKAMQIQENALSQLTQKVSSIRPNEQQEQFYSSTGSMMETPTDFYRTPQMDDISTTTAFWSPSGLVTRPGDETKNIRWSAKLTPGIA